jgi:O-phosphoseryl-tRNA(Sec) selenium transferase, SepSecS
MDCWAEACPLHRYVLWPRIDQKTCLKAIVSAGYEPVPVANQLEGDEVTCAATVCMAWTRHLYCCNWAAW